MSAGGLPRLRRPLVLAAFEGWNDAGDAATGAVEHLAREWEARPLAELDPDDYYDFQVNRPHVHLDPDGGRTITWPSTRMSAASPEGADRDVVLLRGLEPNMRWRQFCAELLGLLREVGAAEVVTLGALLADTPHTRPVPVSGTAADAATAERLLLQPSRYEGPTGIVGVFQDQAAAAGLPSVSLWAAVPHYVAQAPSPKATLALLRRVEDILDLPLPLGELPAQAKDWERQVDEFAANDSDVADYIASLEEREPATDLPEASGEAIAQEFERYLRRRDHGPGS